MRKIEDELKRHNLRKMLKLAQEHLLPEVKSDIILGTIGFGGIIVVVWILHFLFDLNRVESWLLTIIGMCAWLYTIPKMAFAYRREKRRVEQLQQWLDSGATMEEIEKFLGVVMDATK